ncbi:hypothetical protein HYH02_015228 [Chlamydomonas schloesseri]|uniref:WLM domain-containing protein n=1 Tax=Chlamydomonas schloesseri TaxID=2026947 RepID=A0A835SB66_9CHLO|nr:hypothetical protein HYH02_015228 [Chlamydomonas schloesseri]|eukprot:KAG2424072.1 hypothetical protein HYH02_015228 [Chlamydomonas schloesseri]
MLRQVAHQVQPIMRRREWTVPLLSEFFPAQTNLLGLNVGGGGGCTREVKVRLRPARDPDSFLPYESVLHTMLHELVHNVRAPHDKAFYKLLDEITAECEELMAKGVGGTGVGFDGPSCGRLGSHSFIPQHNPHPASLRDVALRAAEERVKRQRIMPIGPQRLGGGGTGTDQHYKTPAAAAAAAAERRCNDNRWCPCERVANALGRAVTAAQQKRAEFNQEQHAQQQSLLGSASGQGAASGGKGGPPGAGVGTSSSGRRQGLSRAAGLEAAGVVTGGAITAGAGGNTHSRGHSLSSSAEGDSGLDLAGVEADLVATGKLRVAVA